jgi:hypothetical protein
MFTCIAISTSSLSQMSVKNLRDAKAGLPELTYESESRGLSSLQYLFLKQMLLSDDKL